MTKKKEEASQNGNFKASEWARQDPDKPDEHLFLWWDSKGVIPKSEYQEIKNKVFKKYTRCNT